MRTKGMDEPDINSTLAGVILRLRDNETGKIIVWESPEPTEQFRNRHYEPLAEKEMGFKKGRRCRRCGSSLSIYNGDKKCNSCLGR